MIYDINGVSFTYPHSERRALSDVSLTVGEGDTVTILGCNGSGKSTLLGCMLGLIKPQAGTVLLGGKDVAQMREREVASLVGYVPQSHTVSFGFSVMDFVVMGCAQRIGLFSRPGKREREDAEAAICNMGIMDIANRPYTEISGGERQKAMIARAIVSKPRVVLFDEPTAYLDYGSQLLVLRMIRELSSRGYSVVMTTHNPDHTLLLGGKAALLDDRGTMVFGGVELTVNAKNLSRTYKTDIRLEYIENLGRVACVYPKL